MNSSSTAAHIAPPDAAPLALGPVLAALWRRRVLMIGAPLIVSLLTLGGTFLIPPTFTARTSFLPPQPQQSGAANALASLGALAGVAAGGVKNTGDQYLALAQSVTVADRLVGKFDLINRYNRKLKSDARRELTENTRITLGKRDGLIVLEVDDHDAAVAAAMATAYVDELRALAAGLALTEAQQRRAFFEKQMAQVRDKLTDAQRALSATGIGAGALKAEPRAAADGFAKLKAELTAAEIRLQVLRSAMSDNATEVIAQSTQVSALRAEIARQGQNEAPANQNGYVTAYREYKYQEALFDQIARQYEIAKIDESRDGGQLQVVDPAQVPDRKSKPKRSIYALIAFGVAFLACAGWVLRQHLRRSD